MTQPIRITAGIIAEALTLPLGFWVGWGGGGGGGACIFFNILFTAPMFWVIA
jgi:hypothetical protein